MGSHRGRFLVGAMHCFAVEICGCRFCLAIGEGMTAWINGLQRCPPPVVDSARGDREGGVANSPELFFFLWLASYGNSSSNGNVEHLTGCRRKARGDHTPLDKYVQEARLARRMRFFFCSVRRSAILRQLFFRGTSF